MNAEHLIAIPAEEKKVLRRQAREKGICINCLSRRATIGPRGGTSMCDFCRDKAKPVAEKYHSSHKEFRVTGMNERKIRLRSEGRCYRCTALIPKPVDGPVPWLCPVCRDIQNEKRNGWARTTNAENRIRAISLYGGKCQDCGVADHRILNFHHILGNGSDDGEKKNRGNRMVRRVLLDGFDPTITLLCANCHTLRHWHERNS